MKCALAVALGSIPTLAGAPEGGWATISAAIVVLQVPTVGGAVDKAVRRIGGTLAAAVVAQIVLLAAGPHDMKAVGPVVILGAALGGYMALNPRVGYGGVIFCISLAIMLGFPGSTEQAIQWRTLNILIGSVIALAVSRFVLPLRASRRLEVSVAHAMDLLGRLFAVERRPDPDPEAVTALETRIAEELTSQRALANEARRERLFQPSQAALQRQVLEQERKLLGRAIAMSPDEFGREMAALDELRIALVRLGRGGPQSSARPHDKRE